MELPAGTHNIRVQSQDFIHAARNLCSPPLPPVITRVLATELTRVLATAGTHNIRVQSQNFINAARNLFKKVMNVASSNLANMISHYICFKPQSENMNTAEKNKQLIMFDEGVNTREVNLEHILACPIPVAGHMTPFIKLVGELLHRGKITTVLILSPASVNLFDGLLCLYPHTLHLVRVYDLEPFPDANSISVLATTIKAKVHELQLPLPIVLVADIYFTWSASLAHHLAIPSMVFTPSSALVCYHLISTLRLAKDAHGICIYTSHALERDSIHNVKTLVRHNRVWALVEGPLLPDRNSFLANIWVPEAPYDILSWLEEKDPNSVVFVYICFGSRDNLTAPKLMVLTSALEASTINFIFCAKPDDSSNISHGFEERMSHHGLIIRGWARQSAIVTHPAVGSFMTNCGWSSIMEGIAAGVPMLAWLTRPDQHSNSKLLVDDLSIARRVCQRGDEEGVPASNEQARLLNESLNAVSRERERR